MAAAEKVEHIFLDYKARPQFKPFHARNRRFACIVAHRRAGKTVACIMDTIDWALRNEREAPRYAYVAPFLAQAKETAWDYLKRYARPVTSKVNESELWVELCNGARIRIHGADNPDRLRGTYLDGVVLDEYADMRPSVWGEVIGPMLADRQGWAIFIGTPRGRNEFWEVYERAKVDDAWYHLMLKASDTHILNAEELAVWRQELTPEQYEQEFECSFEAAILGAYYGKEMADAQREGRITEVAWQPSLPVYTAWDLGKGANMAVWAWQMAGKEVHVIDYLEGAHSDGIPHMIAQLKGKEYGNHIVNDWVPHDARAAEIGTGRTRIETLLILKRMPRVVADHKIDDGINAARVEFKRFWFDELHCRDGLEALRQYCAEFDEKLKVFRNVPRHDWTSHAADAFRYMAMAWREMAKPKEKPKPQPFKSPWEVSIDEMIKATQPTRLRV